MDEKDKTKEQLLKEIGELRQHSDEIKKAGRALQENEQKFRNIVESTPMGIHLYKLELDGRLIFEGANKSADRILGTDNRQFIGMTIEEAFPSLKDTEVPEKYRLAASEGTPIADPAPIRL